MKKIIWIIVGIAIVGLVIFKLASNKKTTESKVYQFDKEKPISVGVDTIQLKYINDEGVFGAHRCRGLRFSTRGLRPPGQATRRPCAVHRAQRGAQSIDALAGHHRRVAGSARLNPLPAARAAEPLTSGEFRPAGRGFTN